MTAANLDRTDLLVLAELQRNGRQTNAELAERVHLSASACAGSSGSSAKA